MLHCVPLFPLNTVLFPGGNLSLRIFEPRYLSMVAECMKAGSPFGVVFIREGNEAGSPARFHETGTLAHIHDFDQLQDGTLGLACTGNEKFRVLSHGIQKDNLIVADVQKIIVSELHSVEKLLTRFEPVSSFIHGMLEREEMAAYRESLEPQWEDPHWISFQAAELLPLSPASRQLLLEMGTEERLIELDFFLKDQSGNLMVKQQ